jgi:hypothetical protein
VNIVPDYGKDVREVYIEAALYTLGIEGITTTLNWAAGLRNGQKFGLPSWVPD